MPGEHSADDNGETTTVAQPVLAPPGSPTPPGTTVQRPEVGRLLNAGNGIYCTATLINREFVLSASHCAAYPDPLMFAGHSVAFTLANGNPGPVRSITGVWMLPISPRFPLRAGAPLNSDLMLLRLNAPITDFAPATIDGAGMTTSGGAVSVFGYGGFGISAPPPANPCTNGVDGNKRAVNFNWGTPFPGGTGVPWPVCGGDSGGPTFRGSIPGTELLNVTSNSQEGGSAVHYREEIYEQMRRMQGTNWVTGTIREGVAISPVITLPANSPPSACESQCLANNNCSAWNFTLNNCTLLRTPGRWKASPGTIVLGTSGLRPVVQSGVARSGTPALAAPAISALQCASSAKLFGTAAYDWNVTTKQCRLFSAAGTATPSAGFFSGVGQGFKTGIDMPGSDIETSPPTTSSALLCSDRCSKSEECRSFSWTAATQVCRIKFGTPSPVQTAGVTSGIKGTVALPGISLAGTEIATSNFKINPASNEYVPSPVRSEKCRADCANTSGCQAYQLRRPKMFGSTWTCTLFSSVTAENSNPVLFESGYRGLDFF